MLEATAAAPIVAAPTPSAVPLTSAAPVTPAAETTAPPVTPSTPTTGDWQTTLSPELKDYATTKGFKDPGAVLDGYRNLEKLRGVPEDRLLKLPEKADDVEGWNQIFNKLGRPDKPENYNIQVAEEKDKVYVAAVQKMFHESGLTTKQAETFHNKMTEYAAGLKKDQATAELARAESDVAGLKKDWGMAFDQNVKVGAQAAKTFGLTPEVLDSLQKSMGYAPVMKLFHNIGSKLGEADFVTGSGPDGRGVLSPEQARARINSLTKDQNFAKRYTSGDTAARSEMEQLHRWLAPEPE